MSIVYDAATVKRALGVRLACKDRVPRASDNQMIVYYGGWNLAQLRRIAIRRGLTTRDEYWFEDRKLSRTRPGYFRLLLPVPNSDAKDFDTQLKVMAEFGASWKKARICVAMTALLVHLAETGNDPLAGKDCRCAEWWPFFPLDLAIGVHDGRVTIDGYLSGIGMAGLVMAAARRVRRTKVRRS